MRPLPVLLAALALTACRTQPNAKVGLVPVQEIDLGPGDASLAIADFDGDGRADVLATLPEMRVFRGSDGGTLVPGTALGPEPQWPLAGDFDGDGRADLVFLWKVNDFPLGGEVRLGRGDGTFRPGLPFASEQAGGWPLAAADLDGNRRSDLLAVNGSLVVPFWSQTGGRLVAAEDRPAGFFVRLGADLDGDGRADLAGDDGRGHLAVALGAGDGSFAPARLESPAPPLARLVAADMDLRGDRDLVGLARGGDLAVWLAAGGAWRPGPVPARAAPPFAAAHLAAADLDGDGRTDVVLAPAELSDLALLVECGGGDGRFVGREVVAADEAARGSAVRDLRTADLDGDGLPEVLLLRAVPPRDCAGPACAPTAILSVFARAR